MRSNDSEMFCAPLTRYESNEGSVAGNEATLRSTVRRRKIARLVQPSEPGVEQPFCRRFDYVVRSR